MPLPIQGLVPQRISLKSALPKNVDSQAVAFTIDFGSAATPSPQNIDLSASQLKNQLGQIKSMYIDNSDNEASVTITNAVTRQQITIPGGYQAYMPVASTVSQFQIETSGDALVGFDFLNVEVNPIVWSASPATTTIGSILFAGSAGIDHSANQPAFPPAGLTLLATVAANTSRALVGVQAQDANQVQAFMVTDSGNHIRILLESGGGTSIGGGSWTSQTCKGQVLVYGTAGDEVSVYEN